MASERRLVDANVLEEMVKISDKPAWMVVRDAPTVDAVEVVRCKECRWARPKDHREPTDTPEQMLICQCFMNHHIPAPWTARLAVNPEHFCSYGERKDNE